MAETKQHDLRLAALRERLVSQQLDGWFVGREDMYQGEEVQAGDERLAFVRVYWLGWLWPCAERQCCPVQRWLPHAADGEPDQSDRLDHPHHASGNACHLAGGNFRFRVGDRR